VWPGECGHQRHKREEITLKTKLLMASLTAGFGATHVSAAEFDVVFAYVPQSHIPYWRKFQIHHLTRSLKSHQRQLFTLDQPVATVPSPLKAATH
jgi:hypothetical protein